MARLEFAGARYVRNYHLAVPHHELVIDKRKSYHSPSYERSEKEGAGGWSPGLEDNLILHGDNLKALKSLLPHFAGKVKCIYIDPPYNTGNEGWVYNDNVSSPRHKDWLGKVVDKDCQDRHDRWLSMMMPRLKLLRELMREDGVIFISIDENEVFNLHMLVCEVFGESNVFQTTVWQRHAGGGNDSRYYAVDHEYVVSAAKNSSAIEQFRIPLSAKQRAEYTEKDKNFEKLGPYKTKSFLRMREDDPRPGLQYEVVAPDGTKIFGEWKWEEKNFKQGLKDEQVFFRKDKKGQWTLEYKIYLNWDDSSEERLRVPRSLLLDIERNAAGKKQLRELFGKENIFPNPKPIGLVSHLLQIGCGKNDLILDSFAGSGTTAHAVLALNKEDGGNRKFILVEQEDYADTITAERVRRVIKGVKNAKDENLKNGLGGSFTFVTLGAEYDVGKILSGKSLPSYEEMAAYVFQTATGETLDRKKIDKKSKFIGASKYYDVYLLYEPDVEKLKSKTCALTLDFVDALPKNPKRKQLIFGAVRYVNQETLTARGVEFSQLPYEVYRRIDSEG